jgi:hypothetical protein
MPPEEGSKRRQPPRTPSEEADTEAGAPQSRAKGDRPARRRAAPTPAAGRKEPAAGQGNETEPTRADIEAETTPAEAGTATESESGTAAPAGATPRPVEADVGAPGGAGPPVDFTVSDVWVRQEGPAAVRTAALDPNQAFTLQVHFRLQGPNARALTTHKSPFDARVYAEELTTGARKLLAVDSSSLEEGKLDYAIEMPAPGLSSGQHRLLTLVAIHAPINMIDHHRGPVLDVFQE